MWFKKRIVRLINEEMFYTTRKLRRLEESLDNRINRQTETINASLFVSTCRGKTYSGEVTSLYYSKREVAVSSASPVPEITSPDIVIHLNTTLSGNSQIIIKGFHKGEDLPTTFPNFNYYVEITGKIIYQLSLDITPLESSNSEVSVRINNVKQV